MAATLRSGTQRMTILFESQDSFPDWPARTAIGPELAAVGKGESLSSGVGQGQVGTPKDIRLHLDLCFGLWGWDDITSQAPTASGMALALPCVMDQVSPQDTGVPASTQQRH